MTALPTSAIVPDPSQQHQPWRVADEAVAERLARRWGREEAASRLAHLIERTPAGQRDRDFLQRLRALLAVAAVMVLLLLPATGRSVAPLAWYNAIDKRVTNLEPQVSSLHKQVDGLEARK